LEGFRHSLALGGVHQPAEAWEYVQHLYGRRERLSGSGMREYQVIKERDEPHPLAAQESDRVTHHRREYERSRGEAKRKYH
jgi:hypothetical protein